jgi:hopanoid biosynthesis associated radical SAM protein HpnH
MLLEKKLHLFTPSPYLTFSVHLDGLREEHDRAVCQEGVFDRAVAAIRAARDKGFRVNINCTLFDGAVPENVAEFFDFCGTLGVEGITVSPGYAYERAPDQAHFLTRKRTKQLFRDIFGLGKGRRWRFSQSVMFLDFLAGNQSYHCTPWGNPTRNIFGWQKPCYLLGEGNVSSFRELMETTEWDSYGTGAYEKCADCMVHCGYEPTAVSDTVARPLRALSVWLRGVRTEGPMAPEIDLTNARAPDYVFESNLSDFIEKGETGPEGRENAA